jgi:hypothetical protein
MLLQKRKNSIKKENKFKSNLESNNDKNKKINTLNPEKDNVNLIDEKNNLLEEKKIIEMIKEKPLNLDVLEDKARIEIKETSERSEFSLEKVLNEKSGNRDNLNSRENHMKYKRPESKPLYILV